MLSLQNTKSSRNRVQAVRYAVIVLLSGALLMISAISTARAGTQGQTPTGKFRRVGNPIPNQYIIVLDDDTPAANVTSIATEMSRVSGGTVGHVYRYALKGFSATMPEAAAIALSNDPRVEFIEEDTELLMADTQVNPPSWGLDRVDQANLPVDGSYTYNQTGAGINVYVIDSGIRFSHQDFGGRAFLGTDFVGDGRNGNDCNGHGTHVSGTIGGRTYGVAKNVNLYSVRIFPCAGGTDFSTGTAAVDWVTVNQVKPAVANLSIQGLGNTAFDKAVRRSIAAGVTYVGIAGNFNADASLYSPARITQEITVGATGDNSAPYTSDNRWLNPFLSNEGSNYGTVLDLFAPGAGIVSAWYTSDTDFQTLTGTSQAGPHVTGATAMYLQTDSTSCQSTVSEIITNNTTSGVVGNPGTGSPNKLLFTPQTWPTPTYYSLSLDGTGNADVPNAGLGVSLDITGPLTLEAWVRLNNNTTRQAIVERYNPSAGAGTNDGGYALRLLPSGKVRFFVFKNGVEFSSITGATVLTTGTWYHVAGVYDGAQLKIYVQGMSDATPVTPQYTPQAGTTNLKIGVSPEVGSYFFNGLIDEVRVTARAVYTANFTPQQKLTGVIDTKGLWRFDRQTAKDCADIHNGTLAGGAGYSTIVP